MRKPATAGQAAGRARKHAARHTAKHAARTRKHPAPRIRQTGKRAR